MRKPSFPRTLGCRCPEAGFSGESRRGALSPADTCGLSLVPRRGLHRTEAGAQSAGAQSAGVQSAGVQSPGVQSLGAQSQRPGPLRVRRAVASGQWP